MEVPEMADLALAEPIQVDNAKSRAKYINARTIVGEVGTFVSHVRGTDEHNSLNASRRVVAGIPGLRSARSFREKFARSCWRALPSLTKDLKESRPCLSKPSCGGKSSVFCFLFMLGEVSLSHTCHHAHPDTHTPRTTLSHRVAPPCLISQNSTKRCARS